MVVKVSVKIVSYSLSTDEPKCFLLFGSRNYSRVSKPVNLDVLNSNLM